MGNKKNDGDKYLCLKINTYILFRLYNLMGNMKYENFKKEEGRSYKSWYDIFDELGSLKNKYQSITEYLGKTKFGDEQIAVLNKLFRIEKKYFTGELCLWSEIGEIDLEVWKIFFTHKYKNVNYLNNYSVKKAQEITENIEKALEDEVEKYKKRMMSYRGNIYRICFFYENGRAYQSDDISKYIDHLVTNFINISAEDWNLCDDEVIKKNVKVLDERVSELNAYLKCKKFFEKK